MPKRPAAALPFEPFGDAYVNPATGPAGAPGKNDISPESVVFIPAPNSPTGSPLLAIGNEASGTATLYSINLNQAPTVDDQVFAIEEKSAVGTVVGTVAAADANPNQTLFYEITGGNSNGAFAINSQTGVVTVANATPLVFQTNPTIALSVKVTDVGSPLPNASNIAVVTINLTNVSDFSIKDAAVIEGNAGSTLLQFNVVRDSTSGVAAVGFATTGGMSIANVDYQVTEGTVLFTEGVDSKFISVKVFGDTTIEKDDTVLVELSNPVNGLIADGFAQGEIINDDGPSQITINDVSVTEGNSGTKLVTFTESLSAASPKVATVRYDTQQQSATANLDYAATNGQLTFAAGEKSKTVSVTIKGDTVIENNEQFRLNLSSPVNATLADGQGVATIVNDDPTPVVLPKLSIGGVRATEGNSGTKQFSFLVTLNQATSKAVTVKYATSNGTATAGVDYLAKAGTIAFAAGQTSRLITVTVKGDTTKSINETFFVTLSQATNATITVSKATGTIVNDD